MTTSEKFYGRVKLIMVKDEGAECRRLLHEDLERLPKLKEALKAAQDAYSKITSRYPAECYELFLEPSSVEVGREEIEAFKALLGEASEAPFRQGGVVVEWEGRKYKVWIDLRFCG